MCSVFSSTPTFHLWPRFPAPFAPETSLVLAAVLPDLHIDAGTNFVPFYRRPRPNWSSIQGRKGHSPVVHRSIGRSRCPGLGQPRRERAPTTAGTDMYLRHRTSTGTSMSRPADCIAGKSPEGSLATKFYSPLALESSRSSPPAGRCPPDTHTNFRRILDPWPWPPLPHL